MLLRRLSSFLFSKTREPVEPPYLELQRDFLDPADFYSLLSKHHVNFYTGVPDSLLKDFCAYVSVNLLLYIRTILPRGSMSSQPMRVRP